MCSIEKKLLRERGAAREGEIVTGRTIFSYLNDLGINRNLLHNKKILNFGSGYSHLAGDLQKQNNLYPNDVIPDKIIELDLKKIKKKNRLFIQADGRYLPFKNREFDIVLALWSTYQIPATAKEKVFKELLRVADVVHIEPIFSTDFDILEDVSKECKFDIVLCVPSNEYFTINSKEDYNNIMLHLTPAERIKRPTNKQAQGVVINGKEGFSNEGGNLIILKRRTN